MSITTDDMILDLASTDSVASWEAIDDRIMGGCSQSRPEIIADVGLCFSGTLSRKNNGGFASIRSDLGSYDLEKYAGLKIRLRGDGKTYKLSLRTDLFFDGVSYQTSFATVLNRWQEITLLFNDFTPTHHGIKLTTVAPMDTANIRSFGFFISDQQEGPFKLDVAWIKGV